MTRSRGVFAPVTSPLNLDETGNRFLKDLNPEQVEVVLHDKGPLLAGAVAGAGKTSSVVRRIAYLTQVRGVDPSRILAVTFSKKGADEMNDRLKALIGPSDARIGTFHSLALEIVKREVDAVADWKIDDKNKYRLCIKDACGYQRMKWTGADVSLLEQWIGFCKAHMAGPENPLALEFAQRLFVKKPHPSRNPNLMQKAYFHAEDLKRERMLLTFDDMLIYAVEVLQENEDVRQKWASRYDYVIQDEAQDQNLPQIILGQLLAKDHTNYMLVGDPGQTVFSFRGAQPKKLLSFEQDWGAKVILMNRNYRCGSKIIDVANTVLRSMDPAQRLDMEMMGCKPIDGEVEINHFRDLDHESQFVAARIQEIHQDNTPYSEMAVLFRTNAQSRAIEEACLSSRIPYQIIGGINFYERKEVRSLLSYLRLADGRGDHEDIGRCINSPFRFLGKAFVDKVESVGERAIRAAAKSDQPVDWLHVIREVGAMPGVQSRARQSAEEWVQLILRIRTRIEEGALPNAPFSAIDAAKPAAVLEDLILATGYTAWLTKEEGEESAENSRVSNVRELVRAASRFPTIAELLNYIDKQISGSKRQKKKADPEKVTLMSIHKSKGAEYDAVFLIGASDGVLPHANCEDKQEERRLYYVAVTRAREYLSISSARNISRGTREILADPSPFTYELGLTVEDRSMIPPTEEELAQYRAADTLDDELH